MRRSYLELAALWGLLTVVASIDIALLVLILSGGK